MRAPHADPAAFELLDVPGRSSLDLNAKEHERLEGTAPRPVTSRMHEQLWKLAYCLPLIAAIAPIAALLAVSPRLSRTLGENGCLPDGNFALPYTSSIWEVSQSFSITMGFTGKSSRTCKTGAGFSGSITVDNTDCLGYNFTTVKIIDIVFDVLVGRVGQTFLAATAYSIFRGAIMSMMQHTEVGYDTFSAIAFKTGTLASLPALCRSAINKSPIRNIAGNCWLFVAMVFSTVYIIAVPTMVSAMSGYRSYYVPYVTNVTFNLHVPTAAEIAAEGVYAQNTIINTTKDVVDCDGALKPLWGRLDHNPEDSYDPEWSLYIHANEKFGFNWMDYHARYQDVYETCKDQNLTECPAAQIESWIDVWHPYEGSKKTFAPPIYGITLYPVADRQYTHWDCGGNMLINEWMPMWSNSDDTLEIDAAGFCQAGQTYVWGFSFVLTFAVCCLHLVFTILMYLVWNGARARRGQTVITPGGLFKDAALMVSKAQAQYGDDLGSWSAKSLEKEVVHGKKGMSFKEYNAATTSGAEFGDPNSGHWGGT